MIVYSLLFITFLVGFIAIGMLLRPLHWSRILVAVALALFIHLYGTWVYVSFYVKYAFDAAFLVAAFVSFFRKKPALNIAFPKWRMALNVLLSLLSAGLSVLYFTGTAPALNPVRIHFPFKSGNYFVLQGGNGYPANFFHAGSSHSVYALDIVKLNAAGQRSNHIFSKDLTDYFIFADTIFSPCAGIVKHTVSGNLDNIPPNRTRGVHNLNNVLIETSGYYVFLGHLKQACVFVKEGDTVRPGTPLGLAGNSGFSLEPHLHIQVHRKLLRDEAWYTQPPVPVAFNGRQYRLFQIIHAVNNY